MMGNDGIDSLGHSLKGWSGTLLLLVGLASTTLPGCAQTPLKIYDSSAAGNEAKAILELTDSAMSFTGVTSVQNSGSRVHQKEIPLTVRTLKLFPGTYHINLEYEHLAQPKCWQENGLKQCWTARDRGWWLPGATLIPATLDLKIEGGKTYTVIPQENYWEMDNQRMWHPMVVKNES